MSSHNDTSRVEETLLSSIVDELLLEICFEMHYNIKCGDLTLDELYGVPPLETDADLLAESSRDPRKNCSSSQPKIVACPICGETVAGQRFAPHLEKCINGGKRGGGLPKKSSLPSKGSSQSAGFHIPYYTAPRKIDPHPSSLVIRIRLKDGVPRKNQVREGGSLSDFQSWKEIEDAGAAAAVTAAAVAAAVASEVVILSHVEDLT